MAGDSGASSKLGLSCSDGDKELDIVSTNLVRRSDVFFSIRNAEYAVRSLLCQRIATIGQPLPSYNRRMTWSATGAVAAASGRWHLGIGDPDAIAWCIVAAYAVAVALSGWAYVTAARGARRLAGIDDSEAKNQRTLARVWFAVAFVMLALGTNKQLDLQTWLLQTARRTAFEGGWYGDRRRYQADIIGIMLLVSMVSATVLVFLLRRVLRRILITLAGLAMLVMFVTIRAISFHYVDYVLQMGGRLGVDVTLELAGVLLIITSTAFWQRGEHEQVRRVEAEAEARQRERTATPVTWPAPMQPEPAQPAPAPCST